MSRRLVLLAVGLATLFFHLPAVKGEFLAYDDSRFVVRNESIDRIGNPLRFFTDLGTTASADAPTTDIYRPIRTLSYAVLVELAGKEPGPFHALAVVLHALTALLLCAVLLEAGLGRGAAAAGALFFGLHPATVEVTAWVCSLGDAWCGAFSAAAVLLHARDRRAAAHVALVLALFSKEHAVVVPGIWLLWDYFLRRERLRANALPGPALGLLLAVAFLFVRSRVGAGMDQVREPLGGSTGSAVLTMLAGFGFYGATIFFPHGPTFDARVPAQHGLSGPVLLGALLLGLALLGALVGPARRRLGLAWFLVALTPVSNLFVTLKIPTADRFLYLPLMGLGLAAADLFERLPAAARRAAPAALLLLGVLAWVRTGDWRDERSNVRAARLVNPKSPYVLWREAAVHGEDAVLALERGDGLAAEAAYREAARLYGLLLRNAGDEVSIQVWMEVGELNLHYGEWMERLDVRPRAIEAYGQGLIAFLSAHESQKAGRGRVLEGEVVRAADAAATLCFRLAQLDNPELERVVDTGLKLLDFVERRTGGPEDLRKAQLLLAYTIRIRTERPDEAATWFRQVLDGLEHVEETQGVELPFLKAQALFYLSVGGRSREGILRAAALYERAAGQDRSVRLRALVCAARARHSIVTLFGEEAMREEALRILEAVAEIARREGLRMDSVLRAEYEGLLRSCSQ